MFLVLTYSSTSFHRKDNNFWSNFINTASSVALDQLFNTSQSTAAQTAYHQHLSTILWIFLPSINFCGRCVWRKTMSKNNSFIYFIFIFFIVSTSTHSNSVAPCSVSSTIFFFLCHYQFAAFNSKGKSTKWSTYIQGIKKSSYMCHLETEWEMRSKRFSQTNMGWCTKWSSIWFSTIHSNMQWTMFCNKVTQ
jgi:hypothetical protein